MGVDSTSGWENTLDFTLAPVQGFVGQARRTRDFWAGSYLISYLMAHALKAVLDFPSLDADDIVFPYVEGDPLLDAVRGTEMPKEQSARGACVASLPNRFSAECEDPAMVGNAAAEAVREAWTNLVLKVWARVCDELTKACDYQDDLPELARKDALPPTWAKQLHNHWEIYWVAGSGPRGIDQRKNWRQMYLYDETGEVCTMCGQRVVAFGSGLPRWKVRQIWHDPGGIVDTMNSVWKYSFEDEHKERLCALCLVKRIFPHVAPDAIGWPVPKHFPSTQKLAQIDSTDDSFPYYAILSMDGDNTGKHLSSNLDRRGDISRSVSKFSQGVPGIVKQHGGIVVYAGGDDVLALLPARSALPCAASLRAEFVKQTSWAVPMTISAAILYLHFMSPLQAGLATAQALLDDKAKEDMGRDAFVLRVEKRSGSPLTIAKPWTIGGEETKWASRIDDLSTQVFGANDEGCSSRFLYKASELLEPFALPEKDCSQKLDAVDMIPVLAAEYLRGPGALLDISWNEAIDRMTELYQLCRWEPKETGGKQDRLLQPEALPLIRFLAQAKGVK
ncbi:MAG: type III-B CRISPR-associated protein Cas10/Cmr2 [Limnochordia bacterium]